jgi:hypothetical protein
MHSGDQTVKKHQGVALTDLVALANYHLKHAGHDLGANILGHFHPHFWYRSIAFLVPLYRTTTTGGHRRVAAVGH